MGQRILMIIKLLDGISRDLVIKSIGCHQNSLRNWVVAFNQSGIQKRFLPAYSPDLNPIEQLWMWIKDNHFTNWYTKTREALQDRLAMALNDVKVHLPSSSRFIGHDPQELSRTPIASVAR